MKRLTCEMCGSADFVKEDGLFVCQSCGIKYSMEEAKKIMVEGTIKIDKTDDIQNLLKRAFMHIEEGKWADAYKLLDESLNQAPENAQAYVGKLMIQLRVRTEEKIGEIPVLFDESINYKRIMQFGDRELRARFEQYAKKENHVGSFDQIASSQNELKKGQKQVIVNEDIEDDAFLNSELEKVIMLNGVTRIGNQAFSGCRMITSIDIPNSVTSIGEWAFSGCTSLTSVTIGNSVTSIGRSTFCDCTSLTSITIPNSVTSIGMFAFCDCTSLASVTIPDSVTSIDNKAFFGNTSLTSITIPDSVTSIGDWAFSYCESLSVVAIGDSVTNIGNEVFYDCKSLKNIAIPDSVTSIGDRAFYKCTALISVIIPKSVTSIGEWAFYGCTSLMSATIPDSVESIGDRAFNYCTSLTNVTISDSQKSRINAIFEGCDKYLELERQAQMKRLRDAGLCQHCGGSFKGIFTKECSKCGKKKDYR